MHKSNLKEIFKSLVTWVTILASLLTIYQFISSFDYEARIKDELRIEKVEEKLDY